MKKIRKIVIGSAWEDRDEQDGELLLRISLGRGSVAFGFGAHQTTSLLLSFLAGVYAQGAPRPRSVLDVGCGSGILSVACARLGASRVLGLDIVDEALQVALGNAAANGVAELCSFEKTPVSSVPGTFDLVLANVLAPVLRELRDALCARAHGGILILSGFKRADRDELIASYGAAGMPLQSELEQDGWYAALLRARRPG